MEVITLWLESDGRRAVSAFATSFLLSVLLTYGVVRFARARGLVSKPSAERWHREPTALFGGVAIVFAAVIGAVFFLKPSGNVVTVGVTSLCIFLVGLYDDWRPMRPAHKFIAQLVAACFFVASFYTSTQVPAFIWLVPLAIVWIVGITNAFNLLDNMDGLASGVAAIVALLLAIHATMMGNFGVAVAALILCGASCGFLVFNFNPARIFMGDCGSMFLGFALACLTLMGQSELLAGNLFAAILLPTIALATPIFDTVFVSIVRRLNGRPISQGGRDHTSHRLVMLGLSERRAVCWLYAITLWFGLIALWGTMARSLLLAGAITVVSAIALIVLGVFLAEVETYSEEEYEQARQRRRGDKVVLSRTVLYKRHLIEALLDFSLICVCWIIAFVLRFEGRIEGYTYTLSVSLPFIASCQMVGLYLAGFYRGMWRYITVSDANSAFYGVAGGTVAASILIRALSPIRAFPWSVILIHSVLLLLAVVGVRMGLRTLRFHFAAKWRAGAKRALVVGAGDAGELAVREMFHNKALQLHPVGFLDDDPSKQRAAIHGVRVLGSRKQLLDVVKELDVDEVIIAMPSIGNGVVQEVVDLCHEHGIAHRQVRGVIL